jgi:hypothetical protein
MTVTQGVERFLVHLRKRRYSAAELQRYEVLLRRDFQYGVALHHSEVPRRLANLSRQKTVPHSRAVGQFLEGVAQVTESVRYISLAALASEHPEVLSSQSRTISAFLQELGGSVGLSSFTEQLVQRVLQTRERPRLRSAVQAFLEFCHENGWVGWNPQLPQRFPEVRVLETDFFGPPNARWAEHARSYLMHLKDQQNLALGGLHYCARKLKPFVEWLDAEGAKDLQLSMLQTFIEIKRSQGVTETTLSKCLYSIRQFLEYLIRAKRLSQRHNPASELRIKAQPPRRRQILNERQLKQLIETLENAIHTTANPQKAAVAVRHFHAVRDLGLVLLFASRAKATAMYAPRFVRSFWRIMRGNA